MEAELKFNLKEPAERERHHHAMNGLNYWRVIEGIVSFLHAARKDGEFPSPVEVADEISRLAVANSVIEVKHLTQSRIN